MLVLGIEASTRVCSVACCGSGALSGEYTLSGRLTHSENLLRSVHRLTQDIGVTMDDIHALAVSAGPGSFTGVRVAVSTVKGLAFSQNKPVVPVSSLYGLARRFSGVQVPVCSLLDARKGEVYACLFRPGAGGLDPLMPERVIAPESLCDEIQEPTLLVGEGAVKYKDLFEERLPSYALFVPGALNLPSALSIGEVGRERLRKGDTVFPQELVPNYIRRSEAETHWESQG